MTTLGRFGAVALFVALALAACDNEGNDEAETKGTTTTTAPATTTSGAGGGPCTTPEEATMSLHDAWANDADGVPDPEAGRCATQAAINTLFGGASGPSPTEMFMGCVDEGGVIRCGYFYEGGGISFTINVADTGYVVESVEFIAD